MKIENEDEIVEAPSKNFNPDDPEDLALVARAMGYEPRKVEKEEV